MKINNLKGFTLIELLVVVAIIGILAAVGVIAYNGYIASAKASATKSKFKMFSKYVGGEIMKCEIGETIIMLKEDGTGLNCTGITYGKIIPHLQEIFNNERNSISIYTKLSYVRNTGPSTNPSSLGSIHLNGISHDKTFNPGATPALDKNDIRLTSCFKEPCSDAINNLSEVINID
tara:strand:- start:96 stop:623 length:528 start_codon:yes stop_codon:yes gene_type:complete